MSDASLKENSLVLYRARPARVRRVDDKVAIEGEDGVLVRVRAKDVELLHPGPLLSLADLRAPEGDVATAWEMLAGTTTTLAELAELAYGSYTPAAAWAAWLLLSDGLYFRGTPERVAACSAEEVAHTQAARAAAAAERQAWDAFRERARAGRTAQEDSRYLRDVEELALGRADRSRAMAALGREETPENAHALLLDLGHWPETLNPYPARFAAPTAPPAVPLPAEWRKPGQPLPGGPRLDLTTLPAFAIDDPWTDTPDDALSLSPSPGGEGLRIWVHVADAAALVAPDSPLDIEARGRGATLYLPEATAPMLPLSTTPLLGLGLSETSPALSFGIDCTADGEIAGLEVAPSLVRVARLTYEEAEARIETDRLLSSLHRLAERYEQRRRAAGARNIELPEVTVRVRDGEVTIHRVLPLRSRVLVENAMIMAGEAVARHAIGRGLPVPFATQEAPETDGALAGPGAAAMFAARRGFKRSQHRSQPAPHSGLGLAAYVQVTSPLRRYLDLVAHQQLRTALLGTPAFGEAEIVERLGAAEAVLGSLRQAEQWSVRHWKLVYLRRQPNWRGRGVLVDKRGQMGVFILPDLALEAQVHLQADLPLDSEAELVLRSVDLARQDARWRLASGERGAI